MIGVDVCYDREITDLFNILRAASRVVTTTVTEMCNELTLLT